MSEKALRRCLEGRKHALSPEYDPLRVHPSHRPQIAKNSSARKMGFPPIPERTPKRVQKRTFGTKTIPFCALLGVLSGIGGIPTFPNSRELFFLGHLGSVARTEIHKSRPVISRL